MMVVAQDKGPETAEMPKCGCGYRAMSVELQLLARSGASLCSLVTGAVWRAERTTRIIITQRQKTTGPRLP
jgi:hypothetical protein